MLPNSFYSLSVRENYSTLPISLYSLSVRDLHLDRLGMYPRAAICQTWVSTGRASVLSRDIKQTQSATYKITSCITSYLIFKSFWHNKYLSLRKVHSLPLHNLYNFVCSTFAPTPFRACNSFFASAYGISLNDLNQVSPPFSKICCALLLMYLALEKS